MHGAYLFEIRVVFRPDISEHLIVVSSFVPIHLQQLRIPNSERFFQIFGALSLLSLRINSQASSKVQAEMAQKSEGFELKRAAWTFLGLYSTVM